MPDRKQRFIGATIDAVFDTPPALSKKPGCPDGFVWDGNEYRIVEKLDAWTDYRRRGRMAQNMQPEHAAVAASRGSWGVGREYYRVRVQDGRVFELYYDRSPKSAGDRQGSWRLFREILGSDEAGSDLE